MPKLTKRYVELVVPSTKDRFEWDDDLPGFGIRIKPSGVKSYMIQYRQEGVSRRLTLGRHGILTADEARKLANLKLRDVAYGDDPALLRKDARQAPTMKELGKDYMERHAIPNKRPKSIQEDSHMLEKFIYPELGGRKVKDVSRRDIESLLNALKKTPYRANRVRALLSKMFTLSTQWDWRDKNPVQGMPKFAEHKRERWVQEDELPILLDVLNSHPNQKAANVARLLILTGARKGEVLNATWDQFDMKRGVWIKLAHTTKQKKTEHTPLSAQAMALLSDMKLKADPDSKFVFPGKVEGMPLEDIKGFWQEIRSLSGMKDVRINDLRHTFASHLVSSGISLPIVGKLLGHTEAQTTMRYAHLADDPLREAANVFGGKLRPST